MLMILMNVDEVEVVWYGGWRSGMTSLLADSGPCGGVNLGVLLQYNHYSRSMLSFSWFF